MAAQPSDRRTNAARLLYASRGYAFVVPGMRSPRVGIFRCHFRKLRGRLREIMAAETTDGAEISERRGGFRDAVCGGILTPPTRLLEFRRADWPLRSAPTWISSHGIPQFVAAHVVASPAPDAGSTRPHPAVWFPNKAWLSGHQSSVIRHGNQFQRCHTGTAGQGLLSGNVRFWRPPSFDLPSWRRTKRSSAQPPAAIQTWEPTAAVAVRGYCFLAPACCRGSNICSRRLATTMTALRQLAQRMAAFQLITKAGSRVIFLLRP